MPSKNQVDIVLKRDISLKLILGENSVDMKHINKKIKIRDNYLQFIKSGEKTLEIRVAYDRIKAINIGEVVEFCSEASTEKVRIIDITNYTSFDDLLSKEDPQKIIPGLSKYRSCIHTTGNIPST